MRKAISHLAHYPVRPVRTCSLSSNFLCGITALAVTLTVSACVGASPAGLTKPVQEREVLLKAEREGAITPFVIAQADDGGFVIAGSSFQGWAAKTDATGHVLWQYTVDLLAEDTVAGASKAGKISGLPDFRGAVPMPDGTVYLCGFMPRPSGKILPGLLTHLDAKGRVLSERRVVPQVPMEGSAAHLSGCVRWRDGVAILGDIRGPLTKVTKEGERPQYQSVNWYWLLLLDSAGNVTWEKQIPPQDGQSPIVGEMVLMASGTSLVFSASSNQNTDVVRLDEHGEVQARKQFANSRFRLVRPVVPDGVVQLFGRPIPSDSTDLTMITLNERLEEVNRIHGQPTAYLAEIAYRMPDRSLVLFGSAVHAIGGLYSTQIVHVDPTLGYAQRLDLPRDKVQDSGSIWAAAPTREVGRFVTVMTVVARGLDSNHPERFGALRDFKLGAALDFIQLK